MHPNHHHRARIHYSVNRAKLEKMIGNPEDLDGVFDVISQHLKAKYETATVELNTKKRGVLIEAYIPEDHHRNDLDALAIPTNETIRDAFANICCFI